MLFKFSALLKAVLFICIFRVKLLHWTKPEPFHIIEFKVFIVLWWPCNKYCGLLQIELRNRSSCLNLNSGSSSNEGQLKSNQKLKSSIREKGASSVCSVCSEAQGSGWGALATKTKKLVALTHAWLSQSKACRRYYANCPAQGFDDISERVSDSTTQIQGSWIWKLLKFSGKCLYFKSPRTCSFKEIETVSS